MRAGFGIDVTLFLLFGAGCRFLARIADLVRGACATTPVLRGLWATTPGRPRPARGAWVPQPPSSGGCVPQPPKGPGLPARARRYVSHRGRGLAYQTAG